VFAVIAEAVIVPLTPNALNVPTDVMFACAAPDTVPATEASATVPETLPPATEFATSANGTSPETLAPATALADVALVANATAPDTFPPATAFAVAANATSPVTFPPAIDDKLAPSPDTYVKTPPVPLVLPDVMFPVTANAPNVPTEVMLVCDAVPNVPFNVVAVTVGADKMLVSLYLNLLAVESQLVLRLHNNSCLF